VCNIVVICSIYEIIHSVQYVQEKWRTKFEAFWNVSLSHCVKWLRTLHGRLRGPCNLTHEGDTILRNAMETPGYQICLIPHDREMTHHTLRQKKNLNHSSTFLQSSTNIKGNEYN